MRSLTTSLFTAALVLLPAVASAQQAASPSGTDRRELARERAQAMRERRGAGGDRVGPGDRGARGGPEARERREAMREAWAAMTPEQREAARAQARERMAERRAQLSPEQRDFLDAQRTYREGLRSRAQELRAQVEAGTITREQMAEQLRAYRDASMPPRPERPAPRPPRGETPTP